MGVKVGQSGELSSRAAFAAALLLSTAAHAGNTPLSPDAWREAVEVRYEQNARETRISGQVSPDLCFSFTVPQEWRASWSDQETRLKAAFSPAEMTLTLRSAQELEHLPQPDIASRDAALLQQDYEGLLGRPAQSVTLASLGSGATRWSATWIDANLPTAAKAMTVEAFIVPLSSEWVLELSLANVEARENYNALVQRVLSGLRVKLASACRA